MRKHDVCRQLECQRSRDWAITAWQQWQVAVERHAKLYKLNITPFNNYNKKKQIVFQV